MTLKDAAPKPARDTVYGLTGRARYLIDKFLALSPNQRAQASDLIDEFARLVDELKTLRAQDERTKH